MMKRFLCGLVLMTVSLWGQRQMTVAQLAQMIRSSIKELHQGDKEIADFLRNDIAPAIGSGHSAFKLRVAINALDLVTRELTLSGDSDAAENARLAQLMGVHGTLSDLNRALANDIASGEINLSSPGVADHLWQTTMEKLAVDQPNYASYREELGRDTGTASPPA